MSETRPREITAAHLQRKAVVYMRQSTLKQVEQNEGSTDHQRDQRLHALRWGWAENDIEVIDKDLGKSGSSTAAREGWKQMQQWVWDGQVGIIFVSDYSRLNRSRQDFFQIVNACRDMNVLLVVDGNIVNFDDPADRFMANIQADVAEYDNWIRRDHMMKGALAKARRGYAVRKPPTGYVESEEKGKWIKDPDPAVREAIAGLFSGYLRLGSLGALLREYSEGGLKFPVRGRHQLRWVDPYRVRLHSHLTNPAHRGDYVFGRHVSVQGKSKRQVDPEKIILVPGHHEPYVTPEIWAQVQAQLRRNHVAVRQPAGQGSALCQGIIRCGRCGLTLVTQFYPRKAGSGHSYNCLKRRQEFGGAPCWGVNGLALDALVAAELLRCLCPPEMESVIAAAMDVNAAYEAILQQRKTELESAKYQVGLARRRYEGVDPDNRLVASTLERDWNEKETELLALTLRQAENPPVRPLTPAPQVLAAIREVAQDLPTLWAAPTTTHQERKRLLRLFVTEVRLVDRAATTFAVEIYWVGGAVSQHTIFQPNAFSRLVEQLHAEGRTEAEIVAEVQRQGLRTSRGHVYRLDSVRASLRRQARKGRPPGRPPWDTYRETLRAPLQELLEAGLSDRAVAEEFNRRDLVGFIPDRPWSKETVRNLRTDLGLPSGRACYSRLQPLRPLLAELVAAGLSDAAIAEELTRRGVRGFFTEQTWTATGVRQQRYRLQILRGPSPRRRRGQKPANPERAE